MALRGRMINNFLELWCLVASGIVGIWVSSTSFQKSNISWPQQPPTERYQILVKYWMFDDSFHNKGPVLVILVPGMIKPSGSVNILMKWGCRGHWGQRGCRVLRPVKLLLRTSKSSRFLNSALFWCFENKNFGGRITKSQVWFWHLFCWRLLRPDNFNFLKTGWWNSNAHYSWSH